MPIMPCEKDGKSGHKYGEHGHCYTGEGSRSKAAKQGRAIQVSQAAAKRAHKSRSS